MTARGGRTAGWTSTPALLAATVVWNAAFAVTGLWRPLWWLGLGVDFVLLVLIAERVGRVVPPRHRKAYERLLAFGFPVLLLIAWQAIVEVGIASRMWFPPPTDIARALWELSVNFDRFSGTSLIGRPWLIPHAFSTGGLAAVWALFAESHVWVTLARVLVGFVMGAIPGILVGVVMGINQTIRLMLDTTMSAVYVLPKIAIFPLVMLLFADPFGEGPKVTVVAISVFFLVAINTMAGVRDIDPVLLQAGRNYGARGLNLLWHIIVPAALPIIFAGLRLALGTALVVIIAVEFLRAKSGVGYVTYYNWQILAPDRMYAGLFTVMMMGAALTYALQWLERKAMPWQRR